VSPRAPSPVIVVDANIVLSVALGLRSRPVFEAVQARYAVLTSARARDEILGRARSLGDIADEAVALATMLLHIITVVDESLYADRMEQAAEVLRLAPASRNGSTADAHLLALAWALDADLWSHDRDFAGSGWPSWSNGNLRASLDRGRPAATTE
jgi:predicted nucleic acid-binding protein